MTDTQIAVLVFVAVLIGIFIGTSVTMLANLYTTHQRRPEETDERNNR